MSLKMKVALSIVGVVVILAGWFLMVFRPNQQTISDLRDEIEATQEEIVALEAQLLRLQALRDRAPELREEAARFSLALPTSPRVPDFILQVQEAADQARVDFLTITPSLPAPFQGGTSGLQAVGVSISTTGSYFTLQDFIHRLERLDRAVRVNSFSLSAPGQDGTMQTSLSMQMFSAPAAVAESELPAEGDADGDAEADPAAEDV